jgi:CBS domain containing-hemolysin-like protein
MNPVPLMLLMTFCLASSFLLSGMEAGVFALSRLRIRQMMRSGDPRAEVLHGFLERPENFFWTILVGNTLANFVLVALLVWLLHGWLGQTPAAFVVCFLAAVFLFYAACDLLPKMLFRIFPNRLCLRLARPFRLLHLTLSPLVALVTRIADDLLRWTGGKVFTGHLFANRDELRQVMQESAQVFTSEERAMINRVLDLQNLTVRQVMIPLAKAATIGMDTPMRDVLELCREKKLTRVPVWQGEASRRRIVGVVSLKELLYLGDLDPEKTAKDYLKPALYLEENTRLEEALRQMQRSGHRLAIVLAADKSELGVVTLEDVLKVIFGEVSL